MNERLKAGFTLILRVTEDKKIRGGYLKSTKRGIIPCELCGDEMLFISNYSRVLDKITTSTILQVYYSYDGYVSMIGIPKISGPYGEEKYLDVVTFSISDTLPCCLEQLNQKLCSEKNKVHHKVYKYYGDDKYNIVKKEN